MVDSYVLLTLTPRKIIFVRLACVKYNDSVHPEPGSTSRFISLNKIYFKNILLLNKIFYIICTKTYIKYNNNNENNVIFSVCFFNDFLFSRNFNVSAIFGKKTCVKTK